MKKKIIISLISHLAVCLILAIISFAIVMIWPKTTPYVSAWFVCSCLCILSVWDAANFGLEIRHIYSYFAAMGISIITFIFGSLDWLFKWNILISPWRQIAVFESLPLGLFFFLFLLILLAEEEEPSVARGWPERKSATA